MTRFGCILTAAVLLAAPLGAQSLQQRADSIFSGYADAPGCVVGVDRGDSKLIRAVYGKANLEWNIPITTATIFEAGSVSKQFVAAAVLLLESRGLLSLDDEVQKWFPEVPRYSQAISLRHLMLHTSGLRDWGTVAGLAGWPRGSRVHTHVDALAIITRQMALNHEPGERFSYTNTGYNLLTMLVERASGGMSMAEFTRREFFAPLGMTNTSWRDDHSRIVSHRSQAYRRSGGEWRLQMPFENVHGNGGLLTTADDLLKWAGALMDGEIGRPDVSQKMRTMGLLRDGSASGYGGGLFLGAVRGVDAVRHTGATAGYRAVLSVWPESDLRSVLLCNRADASASQKELALLAGLLRFEDAPAPRAVAGVPTYTESAEAMRRFVGRFNSVEVGATWEIVLAGGMLRVRRRVGEEFTPLRVIAQDRLVLK